MTIKRAATDTRAEGRSAAERISALPKGPKMELKIGSIWREVDGRFTRHIEVVGFVGGTIDKVAIKTVSADDGRQVGARTTHAKASAFGHRYKFVRAALSPAPADEDEASRCIACAKPMQVGDLYYPDESGGVVHAECVGPERESYTYNGEPLKPDQPIPGPYHWTEDDAC